MPLYEFQCVYCEQITEHECKIADRPKKVRCQHCGSTHTHQIISDTSFQLKGGRWASSGYSSGSGKKKGK